MRPTPFRKAYGAIIIAGVTRRMRRRGLLEEIEQLHDDESLQVALIEEVQQRYGDEVREKGDLLKWLSEHSDEIIKILLLLLTLFAEKPPRNELTPEQLAEQLNTEFSAGGPDII